MVTASTVAQVDIGGAMHVEDDARLTCRTGIVSVADWFQNVAEIVGTGAGGLYPGPGWTNSVSN
jgi:hypothetical protein